MIHEKMLADLRALGVREGGCLLVHSSYKSLGGNVDGPEQVIRTLFAAVGDEGTLLFPTLSYETVNAPPRGVLYFHVNDTPSCVGVIPEFFRKMPGVRRSIHPTHSVAAMGKRAAQMTANHEQDTTPVGKNSPFSRLRDMRGQILMLGCGPAPNTSMHGVEERAHAPYLFKHTFTYTCVGYDGCEFEMRVRRHNFQSITQRYDRLIHLMPQDALRMGRVLSAECHLMEAAQMWDIAERAMRTAPLFFTDSHG